MPGTAGGDALSRARRRLAARNSLLEQSLADHAERVDRRNRDGDRAQQPTAAERMAALRRRLVERQAAYHLGSATGTPHRLAVGEAALPCSGGGATSLDGATQLRASTSSVAARDAINAPSIEDAKIHFGQEEYVVGDLDSGTRTAQATAAAASFAAWHSAATTAPAP